MRPQPPAWGLSCSLAMATRTAHGNGGPPTFSASVLQLCRLFGSSDERRRWETPARRVAQTCVSRGATHADMHDSPMHA